MNETEKPMKTK